MTETILGDTVHKKLSLGKDVMVLHLGYAGGSIDQSKRVLYGWKDKIT